MWKSALEVFCPRVWQGRHDESGNANKWDKILARAWYLICRKHMHHGTRQILARPVNMTFESTLIGKAIEDVTWAFAIKGTGDPKSKLLWTSSIRNTPSLFINRSFLMLNFVSVADMYTVGIGYCDYLGTWPKYSQYPIRALTSTECFFHSVAMFCYVFLH